MKCPKIKNSLDIIAQSVYTTCKWI